MTVARTTLVLAALLLPAGAALAAGDFPLASCKGWNGTVTDIVGRDTRSARMEGRVTKADLREYCERDPGGETTQYGGDLTVDRCVEAHWREERGDALEAVADCRAGTVSMMTVNKGRRGARLPLDPGADASCASGMPPLLAQFSMLCPKAAARMGLE